MPTIVSTRKAWSSVLVAALAGASQVSCQHASAPPSAASLRNVPAAEAVRGHAFGDTISHAVQVLSFNRQSEVATVFVRQPDNVIVLAVEPGRGIEVIFPGSMNVKRLGRNTFTFFMQRFELTGRTEAMGESSGTRQAYEQCMRARAAMLRQAVRRVVRDSSGKVISGGEPELQREPPTCDLISKTKSAGSLYNRAMPPRALRERYLIVLSSTSPVGADELERRMEGLSTTAPDVALTIEAIATGIYFGKPGTYGGTFVSW